MLSDAAIHHEIVATRSIGRLRRRAASATDDGFTEIACAGGDGTVSLVAQAIDGSRIPIGVIPCGTGNILAKHLGIPLLLRPAIRTLIDSARSVTIDAIGRPDGLSVLNLSMGVSSLTMADIDSRMKRVFGTAIYVAGVLLYLLRRNPARFHLTVDGQEYRFRGREVLLSNAGFRRTAVETFFADSDPGDGVMECSVFLASGLQGAFAMIRDVLRHRTLLEHHYMVRLKVRDSIVLRSDPPLPFQADGDPIGYGSIEARVCRRAILVRAPAE